MIEDNTSEGDCDTIEGDGDTIEGDGDKMRLRTIRLRAMAIQNHC